jgi:hypothetical protein
MPWPGRHPLIEPWLFLARAWRWLARRLWVRVGWVRGLLIGVDLGTGPGGIDLWIYCGPCYIHIDWEPPHA